MTVAGVMLAIVSAIAMVVIFSVCSGDSLAVGLIAAGLFMVVGILLILCEQLSKRKKKNIIATGVKTQGIITGVDFDTMTAMKGNHPFKAICQVIDPETDEVYLYSSESVFRDLHDYVGQKVDVFYNKNDRSEYYVDLDSAISRAQGTGIHDYR